jgi:hypothetical protein
VGLKTAVLASGMQHRDAAEQCARCGQAFGRRASYEFQTLSERTRKCLTCALMHASMLRRSALIALVVGTVLTAINQGDTLLTGHWSPALAWKVPMTYAVPFIVATLGALGAAKVPTDP